MFAAGSGISSPFPNSNLCEDPYSGLFRHAGEAMLLVDRLAVDGFVVDANLAAASLFGAAAGVPLKSIFPGRQPGGRDSAVMAAEYSRRAARGETLRFPWRFLRQDQSEFDASVTLSRVGDSEHHQQLAIIRQTAAGTGDTRLEKLPGQIAAQLKSVTAELDAFSYAVSHDLRAAILGIAECSRIIMNDFGAGLNEDAKRWLGHIHDDSVQLDQLTEALGELSRVSRATMDATTLDLSSMALEIVRDMEVKDTATGPDWRVSENLEAYGDPVLAQTLLQHLLDNAGKFSTKASDRRIEFGQLTRDESGKFPAGAHAANSVFYVRDRGIGFDMAYADRLFIPFQRLHRDPAICGNGVGLAVVRRIVHRHGGEVWAEGIPGGGATFFFTLNACNK